jgi:hypothetical protein
VTGLTRSSPASLLGATAFLILVGLALANFLGDDGNGGVGPYLALSAVSIGVAAFILLRVVPQAVRPLTGDAGRTGLILAVLALVLVVVFWTGLPFALGVPAMFLGAAGRERTPESGQGGQATAALAVGALAVVLAFVACIVG